MAKKPCNMVTKVTNYCAASSSGDIQRATTFRDHRQIKKERSDHSCKRRRSTESRGQIQKEKNGLTRDSTIYESNTQFGWLDLLCIKSHTLWEELKTKIIL